MKKLLAIIVLGLLWCNVSFAEKIKSVHGFNYEMLDEYRLLNNWNIKDSMKLADVLADDNKKKMLEAMLQQFDMREMDILFYKDFGGDNIAISSAKTRSDAMINDTNIEMFCDNQLKMIEGMSKKKVEQYECSLYQNPKISVWSVFTSYKNVFTRYPTHMYTVEFVHSTNLKKRIVLALTCGPKYCEKLLPDFYKLVSTITFE